MKGEKGNGPQRPIGLEGKQGDTLADILKRFFFKKHSFISVS